MSEISRYEYRTVIKILRLEKQPAKNIYECLVNVYSAPSNSTVTKRVVEFKRGRTSFEDDKPELDGQSIEATLMSVAMLSKSW